MIHNGVREEIDAQQILVDRWKYPEVIGVKRVERPEIMIFNNELKALRLIEEHIRAKSGMAIHADVDFDGIASAYLMYNELKRRGVMQRLLIINKEKEHGVKQKHVDYLNKNKVYQLLIVVDSSSKEIETIKKFECDVLVIDHHDVGDDEMSGICNDGIHRYVIVNSTIESSDFEETKDEINKWNISSLSNAVKCNGTQTLSCGLLIYEIMRMWYAIYNNVDQIEKSRIYQWAAASLYTDQIDLLDRRNQWYIQNMNCDRTIDASLLMIGEAIGKYNITLNKSYINFKLVPLINKAIRADAGGEALDIIINKPQAIGELVKYSTKQSETIDRICSKITETDKSYYMINITGMGVSKNYNGVIAARICGDYYKNTVVYEEVDGKYKGSFRGRQKGVDYRQEAFMPNVEMAEGHPTAFGFTAESEDDIERALEACNKSEPKEEHVKHLLSLGSVDDEMRGIYHIETLDELRKSRLLVMLATGNSNVGSADEINIIASTKDVVLKEAKEKYNTYLLMGDLELTSFETLKGKYFSIYAEFGNEIRLYARNINMKRR